MANGPDVSVSFDISEEVRAHVEAEIARAQAEFDRLRHERDEARAVAKYCYHRLPTLVMDLLTGKYWHQEKYPWLKETEG